MSRIIDLHEFFIEGTDIERSHVLLHITEPSTHDEWQKGYFFAITEINDGSIEQIRHLQKMIDDLEKGYYDTDDEEEKNAFEITLEYINRRGHHILQYEDSKINCIVGVLRNNVHSLAYHGNPSALLFFKKENSIEVMNILEDMDWNHSSQLFSSVIEGELNQGDYVYVSSPHVSKFFSNDRIKRLLEVKPVQNITSYIQKILRDARCYHSFGGILAKIPPTQQIVPVSSSAEEEGEISIIKNENILIEEKEDLTEQEKEYAVAPAKELIQVEEKPKTNDFENKFPYLAPKKPKIKNKRFNTGYMSDFGSRDLLDGQRSLVGSILVGMGRAVVVLIIGFFKLFLYFLKVSIKCMIGLLLLITNKDNKRKEVVKAIKRSLSSKWQYISEMSLLSKIIFVMVILSIFAFATGITYLRLNEQKQVQEDHYKDDLREIKNKMDTAEQRIILNDDEEAFRLLLEAKEMINQLDKNSEEKKIEADDLLAKTEENLTKIRKLKTVEPLLITDLSKLSANVKKIVRIDNRIVFYGDDDLTLYRLDTELGKVQTKRHSSVPTLLAASTPKEHDKIVFLTGNRSIAEYDKKTMSIITKRINFPEPDIKIADISIYSRRLYTLDPITEQIYKHNQIQSGYDRGEPWIDDNSELELNDAVSLAVDANIYVLKKNGIIYKFNGGKMKDVLEPRIDPPLENPIKIWTYSNVENLYILDPVHKRVIVVNKNGKLLQQYTAGQWENPTGMIVDENKNEIYIIDSNKLYSFEII